MFGSAFVALLIKEFLQLLRNKQLLFILMITPIYQLSMYGFALSPEVNHLHLGVVDNSNTPLSRDLISALVRNGVFDIDESGRTEGELAKRVRDGALDVGVIIPTDLERMVKANRHDRVQVILDQVRGKPRPLGRGRIARTA